MPNKPPKYCLSLWQPWAMLWALGEKVIETRHWPIPDSMVGKTIFIHAAQRWTGEEKEICRTQVFRDAFRRQRERMRFEPNQSEVSFKLAQLGNGESIYLPFGALIGTVRLVRSVTTDAPQSYFNLIDNPAKERAFGNYAPSLEVV